ncbi:hypothetical protein GQ53DRAFT_798187 [Thozetella sp. PMI_491]|nr:hypothetical protein GQ53DRAFT_798187 [Thozetella sp. PMI_491]
MKPLGALVTALSVSDCPGYIASNVVQTPSTIKADLTLGGKPCDIYGKDLVDLKLLVEYQTEKRLHVKIYDASRDVYQIQESVLPRPPSHDTAAASSEFRFALTEKPFSFSVVRSATGEVLFNTSSEQLVFEDQYVRLQTQLASSPNIYGFGEHSDPFKLPTEDYQRILWNVDSPDIPRRSNLYGSHPIYLDHRGKAGSHGVFLMNANGMNINFKKTGNDHFLEYNTIGGVLDFYFLGGPSPSEVSQQYAEIVGLPAFPPYWSLGFHQCKYGYPSVGWVEQVIANYSLANIPLEVMWIDIDGMDRNQDFTVDPTNFPMPEMRKMISSLHKNNQYFITMLDPGIHRVGSYGPYARGKERDAFLKALDGSDYRGVQWPGEVVWPDWFAPNTVDWWKDEMVRFFNPETGLDVDGLWNDMNEVAQFCGDITCNPSFATAIRNGTAQPIPGFPYTLQLPAGAQLVLRGEPGAMKGLPGRDLFTPPYQINNLRGALSANTLWTNVTNYDGTHQYDTHNLYGLGMVSATYEGLLARRPGKRPFVLSRSTFSGSGTKAAHWFGDNDATWADYRTSIAQMLTFASLHQMPMVGGDVCGFHSNAQEKMCARWATLGAFMPFYRNHANNGSPPQEFYLWPTVAAAARKAIDARYRLLDYIYTAMYRATSVGLPLAYPLMFIYPDDAQTFGIDLQWFFGDAILVSPVTDDDAVSVTYYLPDDFFYDFWTLEQVVGKGATVTADNVDLTSIPVHIRGGTIVPLRSESANTTTLLRKNNFSVIVATGKDGKATGSLYLDDGESLASPSSDLSFSWDGTTFSSKGNFGYPTKAVIDKIVVLGKGGPVTHEGPWGLAAPFSITLGH